MYTNIGRTSYFGRLALNNYLVLTRFWCTFHEYSLWICYDTYRIFINVDQFLTTLHPSNGHIIIFHYLNFTALKIKHEKLKWYGTLVVLSVSFIDTKRQWRRMQFRVSIASEWMVATDLVLIVLAILSRRPGFSYKGCRFYCFFFCGERNVTWVAMIGILCPTLLPC